MSNSINTNIAAYYAQANITTANNQATSSVARLSSGNAIVQASDNVAALAIGNSLGSQVAALTTASTNASQGSSLLQVADGALAQIGSILNQQNSIALQAASGSLTNTDRGFLNQQFIALTNEINALATGTTFNGVNLIDGSIAAGGSANSLQDASINSLTTAVTTDTTVGGVGNGNAGFSQTTNGPAYGTVNFTGFTSTSGTTPFYGVNTNGATQYKGFVDSGVHGSGSFTASSGGISISSPSAGGSDASLFGDLSASSGAAFTTTFNTSDYTINYTAADGTVYTGTLASDTTGAVAAGTTVTLSNTASPTTHGTINLKVGSGFVGDQSDASGGGISAALTESFVGATGFNPYFTNTPVITQPQGGNDQKLFGDLSAGNFTVAHTGTLSTSGGTGTSTGYTVSYSLNGVTYQGTLANSTTGSAKVDAGTVVTLSATTDTATHATIQLTVGVNGFGTNDTVDQNANIQSALTNTFVGSTGYSAGFVDPTAGNALTIDQSGITGGAKDTALYGDLSAGVINVAINGTGIGGTATGYTVSYSLNGVTYQGTLANDGTAGHGEVLAGTTLQLTATSNPSLHATINIKTGSQNFGISQTVDQSANIKAALSAYLTGASVLTNSHNASVTGEVTQSGIGAVSSQNDIGKNDTAFVGDLSKGVFTVTGNASNGYNVSYALNGSTYQGSYTAAEVSNGSTLVLDNGKGTISFALTASTATTPNANLASASTLQSALTNQFSAATAYAKHTVTTTVATDTNGAAIAGSAIPAATTGVLTGFSGSNVTLQSALFSGVNLPSVSNFTSTGSGVGTVLSVKINGTTYSTEAVTGNNGGTLAGATFGAAGSPGVATFYANGDTTSQERLTLDFNGISGGASIADTAGVNNVVTALNNTFGSGGSSGGLQFQLGTTDSSVVSVNIGSARSNALYGGLSLDISTQAGATAAAAQVNLAINTVTSLRAGVGALESQFNFAAAALQTSTQNQTAAQGQFLDTDIAAESTKYATEQVKLQAGISVLAQANQQLQALLKLIA